MKLQEININQVYFPFKDVSGCYNFQRSRDLYNYRKKASQNCFLNFNVKYFHHKNFKMNLIKPRKYFRWKCTWENKNNF